MKQRERSVLVIKEAEGRRVRQLSLAEPCPRSRQIYLTLEFDDETEILIEVGSRLPFAVNQLGRSFEGEQTPLKKPMRGSIRSLANLKDGPIRQ